MIALRPNSHAVTRWIQRWRPGSNRKDARFELEQHLRTAEFEEMDGKRFIYRTLIGALVVATESGIVETVLPRGATKPNRRPKRRSTR